MKGLFDYIWNMPAWAAALVILAVLVAGIVWFAHVSRARGRAYAEKKAEFDRQKQGVEARLKRD